MNTFDWTQTELRKIGFCVEENGAYRDLRCLSLSRVLHGFIKQKIFLNQSALDRDRFWVILEIGVRPPDFAEPRADSAQVFADALQVEVAARGFDERGWGRAKEYPIDNPAKFEHDLQARILAWLDQQAQPQILIAALQSQLQHGTPLSPRENLFRSMLANCLLFLKPDKQADPKRRTNRPICNKFIADILYQLGERDKAIPYMRRWVEHHVARRAWIGVYADKIKELEWLNGERRSNFGC